MKKQLARVVGMLLAVTMCLPPTAFAGRTLSDGDLRMLAPGPLANVVVPEPPDLNDYVTDRQAAIQLGKAFFWDMQAGSDEVQACASCHFHAGVDNRAKNQLTPGLLDPEEPDPPLFDVTRTGGGGPNYTLNKQDFFFPREFNDVASSQGVFHRQFDGLKCTTKRFLWKAPEEDCVELCTPLDDIFQVRGVKTRRVEPRHTPSVINAVFNHRNFWDGRANNLFNGVNPLGLRGIVDPNVGIYVANSGGGVNLVQVTLKNASLASQAVGPPESPFEMSCDGRKFPFIGRKLLAKQPLAKQQVSFQDSVLSGLRHWSGKGLNTSYKALIQKAFHPKYWSSNAQINIPDVGAFTQMEANFSLFWGLAIQLYEATLVSDQTPFDHFAAGNDHALNEQEKHGLEVFLTKGRCINCHDGAEFTGASVRLRANQPDGNEEAIERMVMGNNQVAVYDGGFYNIGVRKTTEDLGVGADLAGFPLSFARQEVDGPKIDQFNFDPNNFEVPGPIVPGERVAVDGAFKVPSVRNAELTGPYFHSGGFLNLEQVVEFYDKGAFAPFGFHQENIENLDPDIVPLGLTDAEEKALVAFMKALTDERVRWEKAPFDHPELFVPNGHLLNENFVFDFNRDGEAEDNLMRIPPVGKFGRQLQGLPPLGPFLESPFQIF
ncbi:hypothetical protein DESUT3_08770 [Desulfuromonas versatilis]|uniref:Cytochrome c domain-containing protein n=1 Tax=Desulfuromonas versatilis TaxID=2802975 RepID=A0ABM8HT41_9BACT|nr:cytochrome c peroxidase [Desulfuromonas versatilis]BCR03808.1 hypothetical protein DESUT3_08770 [Desulfuromonas versatilis]